VGVEMHRVECKSPVRHGGEWENGRMGEWENGRMGSGQ
jgi:hypothetical protein